ncbi:MAG: GNAT family N-acetyltransferase [Actinobacteria bacterium]|nr:GNAT family N-acetyltransferase [Actinomycetota bacterium]
MPAREMLFKPVTPKEWGDLERLFGPRGACGGCWCMWWRLTRAEFEKKKGELNRDALKKLVDSGTAPGILAYLDDQPVGWCSVGPRETYPALERSKKLKRIDYDPAWSIVCFFVAKKFRRQGITSELIKAAVDYARENGAKIVEAYPTDPPNEKYPDIFAYTGFLSTFLNAGFTEVDRRSKSRSIVRFYIDN